MNLNVLWGNILIPFICLFLYLYPRGTYESSALFLKKSESSKNNESRFNCR